jgi:tetratricopeptide (TPR) repeat protein
MRGAVLEAIPGANALPAAIGPYRISGLLGVGGMGSVYRAVRSDGGDAVALKTMSAPRESLLPAIRREIHVLQKLRHPGIVRILDSGTHGGIPWYAMDLLESRSLADLGDDPGSANAGEPPSPDRLREVLTIVRRLCEPLAYLHGEGVVHGDIKPSNVLLQAPPASGDALSAAWPVLIDFGLLTTFGEQPGRDSVDGEHRVAGSVAYMAPEQIAGEPIDARADLYALGCLLYELSTGRPPFDDARVGDMLRAHRERAPLPPSAHGAPRALDDLVLGLLAKRPRDRIGYAEDVATRLAALGAETTAPARGPRARPYLYRPGLTGRRETLEGLAAEIAARFDAAQGGMAFLAGESGVGKTRLAIELARRAKAQGARVLSGGSAPLAGTRAGGGGALHALAAPLQAVADRCRAEGPEETRRLLGGRGKLLARYEPALASLPGQETEPEPPELPLEAARALVSHELCTTFEAFCADQPLLLVLDDLQWADELTLAFLAKLADLGTLARARLFVLGTARSDEIAEALGAIVAAPFARRIDLDRLGEDGVRDMIGGMLAHPSPSDAFVRFIARHTEGNPFFVAEYLRAFVNEGLLLRDGRGRFQIDVDDDASLASLPIPRSLRDLVARRLDGLGEGARRVADLAAVVGREVDPTLVCGALALDAAEWTHVTSELCERQVLDDTGHELRFAHDKIREVAYERLGEPARAALHRTVAAVLDARHGALPGAPGVAEAAAHHWLEAGDGAKAVPLLLAAARRNLVDCDNERAMDSYRRALTVLAANVAAADPPAKSPAADTPAEGAGASPAAAAQAKPVAADTGLSRELFTRRALWEEPSDPGATPLTGDASALREALRKAHRGLGDALTVVGRYDEALDEYDAALRHGSGDEARADALGQMAAARFAKGELLVAARHLSEALGHLGERLPESRAGVLASIGASALLLATRLALRKPVETDRALAVERLRVRLLNRLTYIRYSFGFERMLQSHLVALAAAERIASTKEAAETFAHHGPAFAGLLPASARFYARRAVAVCQREGHLAMQMTAEFMAGMCFAFQARWDEAIAHFRASISLYSRVGDLSTLQTAHENLSYVLLYRGDHAAALTEASRALDLAERAGDLRGICNSRCWVALACLRLGDLPRARRVANEAAECLATLEDHVVHCIVHTVLGRVARAEGKWPAARAAFERAVSIGDTHRLTQEEVTAAYTELLELLAASPKAQTVAAAQPADGADAARAAQLLRKARSFAHTFPAHEGPWLRARALLLTQRGKIREAHRTLARALDVLRDRGMRHELARTWEAMASLEHGAARAHAREQALRLYRETGSQADARRIEATFRAESD